MQNKIQRAINLTYQLDAEIRGEVEHYRRTSNPDSLQRAIRKIWRAEFLTTWVLRETNQVSEIPNCRKYYDNLLPR